MTDQDAIRAAAREAIREFANSTALSEIIETSVNSALEKLGIDTVDADATRRDMAHLRNWTESMAVIRKTGIATVVKTLVTGGIATLLIGAGYFSTRGH